ncbi:transposase [Anoxybacillus flavithermus]|nr:transposase [Anoxybacillus flavithermus]MBE2944109.1 transposase [Anoxybacillus flavithermus]MBE2952337.1 transposase [Anoxybacillus flavithermus]MBE2955089.1 transposase [Anoxybacillus flavithermus]MBE2960265.1 transposase [Anoxybacillus flavithermus]
MYDRILAKAKHQLEGMTPLSKKVLSLIQRLQNRKEKALRFFGCAFLSETHVPFDNNQDERDLCMFKVK